MKEDKIKGQPCSTELKEKCKGCMLDRFDKHDPDCSASPKNQKKLRPACQAPHPVPEAVQGRQNGAGQAPAVGEVEALVKRCNKFISKWGEIESNYDDGSGAPIMTKALTYLTAQAKQIEQLEESQEKLLNGHAKLLGYEKTLRSKVVQLEGENKGLEEGIKHLKKWCGSNMKGITAYGIVRAVKRMCNDALQAPKGEEE